MRLYYTEHSFQAGALHKFPWAMEKDACRNGVAPISLLCFTTAAQYLHQSSRTTCLLRSVFLPRMPTGLAYWTCSTSTSKVQNYSCPRYLYVLHLHTVSFNLLSLIAYLHDSLRITHDLYIYCLPYLCTDTELLSALVYIVCSVFTPQSYLFHYLSL
jgi:hypothetical protein